MTDETNSLTRLEEALGRLGAEHEPPKGWEDRVLDVVDKAKDTAELADDTRPAAAVTEPSGVLPWPADARARDAADANEAAQTRDEVDAAHARDAAVAHAQHPADAHVVAASDPGVLAQLPARRRRRWLTIAAVEAVAMAAAGACVILGLASPDFGRPAHDKPELTVVPESLGPPLRRGSSSAYVGDVVHATARAAAGAPHRALWVYHDDRLLLVCPGPHDCRDAGDATIADVVLRASGTYMFVALSSAAALPVPRGEFDSDVAGAQSAGVRTTTSRLEVR
jgi:hypothetical protein